MGRWILSVAVAALSFLAGASTLLLASHDVDQTRALWDDQVAAGRFVFAVSGPRGVGVDAGTCAVVNSWTGVAAAGGRISTEAVRLTSAPGSRYELDHVTPGYVQVLWPGTPDPSAGSVLGGPYFATSAGVASGDVLAWFRSDGGRTIAVVGPVPGVGTARVPAADRHLLAVVPAVGVVDRCLIDVDPDHLDGVLAALRAWFSDGASTLEPIADFARAADPESDLAARASRWWWALAAGLVASAVAAMWCARRADFALHRLLGSDAGTVALLLVVDTVVLVLTPVLLGIASAALASTSALAHDVVRAVTLADCARLVVVLGAVPVLGMVLVARGSVFRVLKER